MPAHGTTTKPIKTVKCPTCGTAVEWDDEQRWRPFCSERCRLIDLGEWFEERHRVSGEPGSIDETEIDDENYR